MNRRSSCLISLYSAIALFAAPAVVLAAEPTPRPQVIQNLMAQGPASDLSGDLELFGQFVGDWAIHSETYTAKDQIRRSRGSVHIGWILYGAALQDVWSSDVEDSGPAGRPASFGTTLRFFDPKIAAWRCVWVAPAEGIIQTFTAKKVGSEIVLYGHGPDGALENWIWSNFTKDRFEWRAEQSHDGGRSWTVLQRIWGQRTSG